jgi:DNA polymerase-3 subunit gamma/tau
MRYFTMYQSLYRKYRPLTFADVTGQDAIVRTLLRQVETERTGHAYLFTGTRGTGKTTCAKILARAVNCLKPQAGEPCNRCANCVSILTGSATDILELDAAGHSGVDNIRALRDETVYSPAELKKRVYIIDEVHMLSTGAFNALLTVLEEPPPHVLFILATTETHKVPATILSRCQKYHFRRIGTALIAERLLTIAKSEGLALPAESAALVASRADGSVRDALSLLDRCVALTALSPDAVDDALGLAGEEDITRLAAALAQSDAAAVMAHFNVLYDAGKEAGSLLNELRGVLHRLLLYQVLRDGNPPPKEQQALLPALTPPRLIQMCTLLRETLSLLPRSANRRIDAELCLIQLAETTGADSNPPAVSVKPAQPVVSAKPVQPVSTVVSRPPAAAAPASPPVTRSVQAAQPLAEWDSILAALKTELPPAHLAQLRIASATEDSGNLVIHVESELSLALLQNHVLLQKVAAAAEKTIGRAVKARVVLSEPGIGENDPLNTLLGLENVEVIP